MRANQTLAALLALTTSLLFPGHQVRAQSYATAPAAAEPRGRAEPPRTAAESRSRAEPKAYAPPAAAAADAELAAIEKQGDYRLAPGDTIRIQVFQNPDLSLETRVPESGSITYPLIGAVPVGGLSLGEAEKKIAAALRAGGYVEQPQVNIALTQVRGNQVSVLGQVNHPGRFPLETFNMRVSDVLAQAGGIAETGAGNVVLVGNREGKPFRKEIDVEELFHEGGGANNVVVMAGDTIYVRRAPVYYIYGQVQKPGAYRIERGMTVQQALAAGGGLTRLGSEKRMRLERRGSDGKVISMSPAPVELVQANDVLYVRDSFF